MKLRPRVFKHTRDGHWKYWIIEIEGNSYITTYGKLDSTGDWRYGSSEKKTTKSFDSLEEATSQANSAISSKLKKGYEECSFSDRFRETSLLPTDTHDSSSKEGSGISIFSAFRKVVNLENNINNILKEFAIQFDSEFVSIQDCEFRSIPRSMEYEDRRGTLLEDEREPLISLAQKVDALILAEPRDICSYSSSPYIRACASWYKENWDPMFILEDSSLRVIQSLTEDPSGPHWESPSLMQDIFDVLSSYGIIPLTHAEAVIKYRTPIDKLVLLPDRVLSNAHAMIKYGDQASTGQVWITSDGRERVKKFVKVSKKYGAWYEI